MFRSLLLLTLLSSLWLSACAPGALQSEQLRVLRQRLSPDVVQQRLGRDASATANVSHQGQAYMAELYPLEKGKGWKVAPPSVIPASMICPEDMQLHHTDCVDQSSDFPDVVLTNEPLVLVYQTSKDATSRLHAWGTVRLGLFRAEGGAAMPVGLWAKIYTALLPSIGDM